MKKIGCLLLILLVPILAALTSNTPARAQSEGPVKGKELVYYVNAFQGSGWAGVLYPQSEKTIYMLGGRVNTLAPRNTLVYYWPITQRYLPDWASLDEPVTARMEIRSNGQLIKVQDLEDYMLQDDSGNPMPDILQLYTGEEAKTRRKAYQDAFDAFWNARWDYYMNSDPSNRPPDQPEPEPPKMYTTALMRGFILNLEPGSYQISLLDNNNRIIAGSQKNLFVFSPRRLGVGYSVIPEQKWTVRDYSATPEEVIYIREKVRLFLEPQQEGEYTEYYYKKMLDPQIPVGSETSWKWFPYADLKGMTMHVILDGKELVIPNQDYTVEQTAGSTLGYSILPFHAGGEYSIPTFSGHEINLSLSPGKTVQIWLVDSSSKIVEGSERTLRGVREPFGSELFLTSLLPLGIVVFLMVRSKRLRKSLR